VSEALEACKFVFAIPSNRKHDSVAAWEGATAENHLSLVMTAEPIRLILTHAQGGHARWRRKKPGASLLSALIGPS
jgi:hypothetical protein